jgi:hypothetical protein
MNRVPDSSIVDERDGGVLGPLASQHRVRDGVADGALRVVDLGQRFETNPSGGNVIKLFTAVRYECT